MSEGTADRQLRERARAVIPGGMYGHQAAPGAAYPQFMRGGRGARVWDVDGNEYVDLMCSYGPVVLGHQHPAVEAAAARQAAVGDCMNAPGPVMVDLAELLVRTVRHADWAILAKNGTDATTMCCTIARAQTGRSKILVAKGAYHGAAPWCTPRPAGVTPADHANLGRYTFNDLASVRQAASEAGQDLAGILVSPFKHDAGYDQELVDPAFARGLRALCDATGAALILDDVRAGFRLHLGSSWEPAGVDPDLSAWSKAIANGRALAAVLGNDAFRGGAKNVFVTGSFWFAAVPMAAAIATIEALKEENAIEAMHRMGTQLRDGILDQARSWDLAVSYTGPPVMPYLTFAGDQDHELASVFAAQALRGGAYLHPRHNWFVSAAMTGDDLALVLEATDQAFAAVRKHLGQLPGGPMSSTAAEPNPPAAVQAGRAADSAEAVLERAGYKPELRRSLRFFSMFAIAFSIISITTGIFLNYGFGLAYWGPAAIWTWPIIGACNMMIALVVAELGTRIPLAGYAYQWSARLVNPTYGWFVGFAGLLYMAVGGGAIMLEVASPLLLSEFNVNNPSPRLVLTVAIILMLLPVVINIISIQVAARVNNVAVFTEIIGTVVFGVLLFVLWGVHAKPSPYGAGILFNTTSAFHNPTWYAFALASLLGIFTLVGFELAADMSEDAVNPVSSVPRGVLWGLGLSVVLGMIALIGFTVAIPDLKTVASAPLPLLAIAGYWLPSWLVKVFVAFVVFSMFAILVVGAGAQSRLVYSMSRDNMLPFSAQLRKVNRRSQTPIVALLVFGVIDLGVMIYGYNQSSAFGTLVGATAIIPYIIYFLITLAYAVKRRTLDSLPGAFSLGRWAWPVIGFVLVYTVVVMLVLSLPAPFHGSDKVLGYGLALAALWYFGGLLWRLKKGTAGVKPVEDLVQGPPQAG